MDLLNRKRMRSEESPNGFQQVKYFVNDKILAENDSEKMKLVHEKTLQLLFKGAKIQSKNDQNLINNNNVIDVEAIKEKSKDDVDCKLCNRKINNHPSVVCRSCNLETCDLCRMNCSFCKVCICNNCFMIFGSNFDSEPCCENCKMLID